MEKMKGNVLELRKKFGFIVVFVLAVAMVCMLDVFSAVSFAATGKTVKNAKIRKSADANSTQVGLAVEGTSVEITGETTGKDGKVWYKVTVDGVSGYIRSDLIDANASGTNTTNEGNTGNNTTSTVEGTEQVVAVEATVSGGNTVRVRTSASTANSNNILTTVANGTKVTIVARTTGSDKKLWYQVKFVVNNDEVIGYIRNDYLTISGEVKPLTEDTVTPPEEDKNTDNTPKQDEKKNDTETTTTPTKRYDTKFLNDKWYVLDYQENIQYDIDKVLTTAKEFEEKYNKETEKTKKLKLWVTIFILLTLAGFGTAGFLFYRSRSAEQEAVFKMLEEKERNRTSDRPRGGNRSYNAQGREKPVIKDGMEPKREDASRTVQNGQRQTNGRTQDNQGVTPQGAPRQGGTPREDQRMSDGQQKVQRVNRAMQEAQRQGGPAQGQGGMRNNGQQVPNGQKVNVPQDQMRRAQNAPQQRMNGAMPNGQQQQRMNGATPNAQPANANRAKNFAQDDENDFEFLNWDSDDE